jgi:hypothetical protein
LCALPILPEDVGFFAAEQLMRIERTFVQRSTGKVSQETTLMLSSRPALEQPVDNAEAMLGLIRAHWQIENGLHYVRDRSYDEDRCQVRDPNSAQILATLRSMARFLTCRGAHRPKTDHQRTTPALHRFCYAHVGETIRWLISPRGPC